MKSVRGLLVWISIFIGIISSILFVSSIFIVVYLFISHSNSQKEEIQTYKYKTMRIYPTKYNETRVSFSASTLLEELEKNEFRTYYDKLSNEHVIMSHFGTNEYVCSGSCFCSEDSNPKRSLVSSGTMVKKGVIVLVAAVSSLLGYKFAKEQLQNECITTMSDSCSPNNIHSEIDDCDPMSKKITSVEDVDDIASELLEEQMEDEPFSTVREKLDGMRDAEEKSASALDRTMKHFENLKNMEEKKKEGPVRYYCSGKCVPNQFSNKARRNTEFQKEIFEHGKCHELSLQGYFLFNTLNIFEDLNEWLLISKDIDSKTTETEFFQNSPSSDVRMGAFDDEEVAVRYFSSNQLSDYCELVSMENMKKQIMKKGGYGNSVDEHWKVEEKMLSTTKYKTPYCVGYYKKRSLMSRSRNSFSSSNFCKRSAK